MNQQKNDNEKQKDAWAALKSLESFNYKEREVKIGEVKIVLAPLTAAETIEVFENSGRYSDEDAAVMKMKIEVISKSIIKINDVELDPKGMLDEKAKIVSSFGDELIDVLFDKYSILDKVIKAAIDKKEMSGLDKMAKVVKTESQKG